MRTLYIFILISLISVEVINAARCCQITTKKEKSWTGKQKRAWKKRRRTCRKIRTPTICNNEPECVFDCDCDLTKFHNDMIQKIEFHRKIEEPPKGVPMKLPSMKDDALFAKYNDMTNEQYVSSIYILAANKDGYVYKLTLDPEKFSFDPQEMPPSDNTHNTNSVARRRLAIADIVPADLQNPPFHSTGSLIHSNTLGTGTVISSYTSNFMKKEDFTWVITAGHVLFDQDKMPFTNRPYGVRKVNDWKFYQKLNDPATTTDDMRTNKKYAKVMDDAVCVYVTGYADPMIKMNAPLDWGLIKFKGAKSATQLKVAYDTAMATWANTNMLMATFKYPMHSGGSFKMQKMQFPLSIIRRNYMEQRTEFCFGGMSGSSVVRHGKLDTIYGIMVHGANDKQRFGRISRITQAKKAIIDRLTTPIIVTMAHTSDYNQYDDYDEYIDDGIYSTVISTIILSEVMMVLIIFASCFCCGMMMGYLSATSIKFFQQ